VLAYGAHHPNPISNARQVLLEHEICEDSSIGTDDESTAERIHTPTLKLPDTVLTILGRRSPDLGESSAAVSE
jgi:hypothetical protein